MEHIGGQAVIEGVMMQSPKRLATSVRLPNGKIKTKKEKNKAVKLSKLPFIRGGFILISTLVKGMKALIWSADQQLGKDEKITKKEVIGALTISIGLALVFFMGLPYIVANIIGLFIGISEELNPIIFNLIDGFFRIVSLLGYMISISFIKDVKSLFQYHGAEHKAVNCFEAKKKLTLANCKKFTTIHNRCGTSFIFIVLLISILVFSIVPSIVKLINPNFFSINIILRILILFLIRLPFVPVIGAISYEVLKIGDKYSNKWYIAWITFPGRLIQKITTKEPTNKQVEVAITSLKAVL